jgi:L-seryl-tRNA(Ser) seleniumtransferase
MAMLAAVEMWPRRDHDAEWKEWERRLKTIEDAVSGTPTLKTWIKDPGRSNVAPILMIEWDETTVGLLPEDVRSQLSKGDPRIEMFTEDKGVSVMPYMMEEGDDAVVAARMGEIFGKGSG